MVEAARRNGAARLLYTSSACVYPGYLQASPDVTPLIGSLLTMAAGRGGVADLRQRRQAAVAAAGAAVLATTTASSAVARCRGSARPAPLATPPATSC